MLVKSIQIASNEGESKEDRIRRADACLKDLYNSGARPAQILFPEIWATGFFAFDNYIVDAEKAQGEIFDLMHTWARRFGSYLHTGSFVEKDGEDYFNTSLLLDPNGTVIAKYRKIHLFGYGSKETEILNPGTDVTTAKTEYGIVGLSTCYDLRFPEQFRAMVDQGTQFFLVASAWPLARLAHWKLFNQVRAVENQSYLLSCNGTGTLAGSQLGGHSMITDPLGNVIASGDENESIVSADIDPSEVQRNRDAFPALKDRKQL